MSLVNIHVLFQCDYLRCLRERANFKNYMLLLIYGYPQHHNVRIYLQHCGKVLQKFQSICLNTENWC